MPIQGVIHSLIIYLGPGTGSQGGYGGDTGRYPDTCLTKTGSGNTGIDDQYAITGHHGGHHHGHHQEETGTGVKPGMADRIIGGVEKATGKVMSNPEMYQRGQERAVSWLSPSICSVLNICFEYQGWRECKG
jgi:hypothetical protein